MDGHIALEEWARDETALGGGLGQEARLTRMRTMLVRMAEAPTGSMTATFPIARERQGAARWVTNPAFDWRDAADVLHAATAQRCRGHARVIVPIDGSSVRHTDLQGDDGVGRIGSDAAGARGLKSSIALACSLDGVPLGVLAHELWARPPAAPMSAAARARRPLDAKESRVWTELQDRARGVIARAAAICALWFQMDREADSAPVLLRGLVPGDLFTVRANADRVLAAFDPTRRTKTGRRARARLRDALEGAPVTAVTWVAVPAGARRAARLARFEIRACGVSPKLRARWSHRALGTVPITAVRVREAGTCPPDETPIEWLLLTSYPVHTAADACEVARAYGLRWLIERLHYTWKSGTCGIEDAQHESFAALAKWATLHLSVAAHRQQLLHLARTQPDLPADEHFDREEIDGALTLDRHHTRQPLALGTTPTLGVLVHIICRLGGYTGKSSGGPPGIKVFARGLERVAIAADMLRALRGRPPRDGPTSPESFD